MERCNADKSADLTGVFGGPPVGYQFATFAASSIPSFVRLAVTIGQAEFHGIMAFAP